MKKDFNKFLSIESDKYKKFLKAYNYAMDATVKETHQAVEGMYHNLNTLQLTTMAAQLHNT